MLVIKAKKPLQLVKPATAVKPDAATASPGASASSVSDYYKRIERCARQIRRADNVDEIINLLDVALVETRTLHSRDEIRAAREQVERAERKIELLKKELKQLRELAHADALTGTLNRNGLDETFAREAARADRNNTRLCVALLDLDDFKQLNDNCGHQTGDNALLHLVNVARDTLRPVDVIARFGGEEFVILLPDTGIEAAVSAICRVQRNLAANGLPHTGQSLQVTFSAGVTSRASYERQNTVISRADEALYAAKRAGKNRVVAAPW